MLGTILGTNVTKAMATTNCAPSFMLPTSEMVTLSSVFPSSVRFVNVPTLKKRETNVEEFKAFQANRNVIKKRVETLPWGFRYDTAKSRRGHLNIPCFKDGRIVTTHQPVFFFVTSFFWDGAPQGPIFVKAETPIFIREYVRLKYTGTALKIRYFFMADKNVEQSVLLHEKERISVRQFLGSFDFGLWKTDEEKTLLRFIAVTIKRRQERLFAKYLTNIPTMSIAGRER